MASQTGAKLSAKVSIRVCAWISIYDMKTLKSNPFCYHVLQEFQLISPDVNEPRKRKR